MVKINLLPAEILERRKYERFYPIIIISGVGALLIVFAIWGVLQFVSGQRSRELQAIEDNTATLQAQAESYRVFEQQEEQLKQREQVAATAIDGRINMGQLAEEISVVLPEEIFTRLISASETEGLLVDGCAPRTGGTNMSTNFKATAATLVRLNALDSLYDVWLTQAEIGDFSAFQDVPDDAEPAEVVNFTATAKIVHPSSSTTAAATPAPVQ